MSILRPLQFGVRLTKKLQARPGQLVYSKERTSITACFYELLRGRGLTLSSIERDFLRSLDPPPKLGRPCIILDRLPDGRYTVCFIAQVRGTAWSPIGHFFRVPMDNTKLLNASLVGQVPSNLTEAPSAAFNPLRLTDPGVVTRQGRFYLFAIPVVRRRINLPPAEPRYLVDGDLERLAALAHERVMACSNIHAILRRDQMNWVQEHPHWQFKNPQEGGVGLRTYLGL